MTINHQRTRIYVLFIICIMLTVSIMGCALDPIIDTGTKRWFSVREKEGTYSEFTNELTYSWWFLDWEEQRPESSYFVCVIPTKLPEKFWEKYDNGSAIKNRDQMKEVYLAGELVEIPKIDKKGRDLYIIFDDKGIISFQLESEIPGEYGFKINGILDHTYTYLEDSYPGDGDEIIIEVPEPEPDELIVIDKGYEEWSEFRGKMNYGCYWTLGYVNGSAFECGHIGSFPYENMTTSKFNEVPYLFEIVLEQGGNETSYFFLSSVRDDGTIYKSDTWTPNGSCGCASAKFNNIRGSSNITITVALAPGESATVSIGMINENYFKYKGDGDPITVTNPG